MTRDALVERPLFEALFGVRLAQEPELLAIGLHPKHLALKDNLRVSPRACAATDFAVADALKDERGLLRLQERFRGGLVS